MKGLAVACDVTDRSSVRAAFDRIVERFGGVDIVVSNAGAAWQGRIGEVADEVLRQSFELNFFAHQGVAQEAVGIMQKQATGGVLLFNVSKQAVNPGPNFGPYGLPKAATLALMRQYALDYGEDGIRANGVNADRIRTGLLTNDMIAERARARGVSERDLHGRQSAQARGDGRGRGAGLRGACQGARHQRPYRHRRWRQHRRGAALKAAPTGSRGGSDAPLEPASNSVAALSVELGRTPHRAITLARLRPALNLRRSPRFGRAAAARTRFAR